MKPFHEQFKDRIDPSDGSIVLLQDEYKAIQLDSFKAGMSEAAEICNTHRLSQFDPTRDGLDGFRKAILAARNAKTSL
jgi:hypothetical protein